MIALQENVTRTFPNCLQQCPTRSLHQECPTRVFHKRVQQERPRKSVLQESPSSRSVPRVCDSVTRASHSSAQQGHRAEVSCKKHVWPETPHKTDICLSQVNACCCFRNEFCFTSVACFVVASCFLASLLSLVMLSSLLPPWVFSFF